MIIYTDQEWDKIGIKGEPLDYLKYITHRLNEIWKAVQENEIDVKAEQKQNYDKQHKVAIRDFQPGDLVLLENRRTKPGQVTTHKKFSTTPFYVLEKVQGENIGPAYALANLQGRRLPGLINIDRLKAYTADRTKFNKLCPPNTEVNKNKVAVETKDTDNETDIEKEQHEDTNHDDTTWYPALKIKSSKGVGRNAKFLVLFEDNTTHWCNAGDVSDTLKREYALRRRRKKRRT